ncbi:MAG: LicD family protein [Phascolarctobacterium sp.]|nr:LicD family protein [Candidatus Phascolarctobacterium equi]
MVKGEKIIVENGTIRKAQLKILEILCEIDRVCKLHSINFYLAKGTLLGAVKYHGFIPWDDDCDIYMMRKDYEIFEKYASKDLASNLFFQTKKTDTVNCNIAKVRMNGTKLVAEGESEEESFHQGLFVDVFILDYYPEWAIHAGNAFNIVPNLRAKRKMFKKGGLKRAFYSVAIAPIFWLHTIFEKPFIYLVCPLFRSNPNNEYMCQEAKLFNWLYFKTKDFWPSVKLQFEGHQFLAPGNFEDLLQKQYGVDYRDVEPPKEARIPKHAQKIVV